jgi:hypothetical protein
MKIRTPVTLPKISGGNKRVTRLPRKQRSKRIYHTPYELTRGGRIREKTAKWDDTKPAQVCNRTDVAETLCKGGSYRMVYTYSGNVYKARRSLMY